MRWFHRLYRLLLASRPVFWFYTGGLYVLGSVIGAGAADVHWKEAFLAAPVLAYFLWFVVGENFFGVLLNDYFDRDADARNPRKLQHGSVYDGTMFWFFWTGIALSAVAFVALCLYFPNPVVALFGLVFFAMNVLYNVPPARLKERPFLDMLIGPACALAPACSGYALVSGLWPAAWAVGALTLAFAAFDLFDKVFDREADAQAGMRTSAVAFGRSRSLMACAALFALAALLTAAHTNWTLLAWALPLAALLAAAAAQGDQAEHIRFFQNLRWWYALMGFAATSYVIFAFF